MLTGDDWAIIALSLRVSVIAIALCLPVAFALAYALARGRFVGRMALDVLVHLPLVLPPVVTGWLLLIAFAHDGPAGRLLAACCGVSVIFRWTGAALASAVMALPLMVRSMRLSIEAVNHQMEEAARGLGAGRLRVLATITLPLAMPGVLAGVVLGLARSLGEFGATISFVASIPGETRTLPLAIYEAMEMPGGDGQVWRLALVAVALSVAALIISEVLARRAGWGRRGL